jgi:hypothetical protein
VRRNDIDFPRVAWEMAKSMRVFVMVEVGRARQVAIVSGLNKKLFTVRNHSQRSSIRVIRTSLPLLQLCI